ncbi:MAG: prenyltransferase/squalene oxidase repeat-containing protein [Terriglobia bacterium]
MFSEVAVSPACQSAVSPIGLLRSVCLQFLATSQNADGGWGHHPGSESSVEATAWALMALAGARSALDPAKESARGFEWLHKVQLPDGSWPAFKGLPEGCWATSLAGMALAARGESAEQVAGGVKWLADAQPGEATLWRRLQRRLSRGTSVARANLSLHGWSWTPGTASWVEPTAYALIFLSSVPQSFHSAGTAKRILLAESMLYDRMCPGGGWNSGNPEVYGVAGVPRAGPTAWALVALRHRASRPENRQSLNWLEDHCSTIRGPASLALLELALACYGRRVPALAAALGKLYGENRFFRSVLVFAWAALALGGKQPWSLPDHAQAGASER